MSVITIDTTVENARTISSFGMYVVVVFFCILCLISREAIGSVSKISPHLITASKSGFSFKSPKEADKFYRILIEGHFVEKKKKEEDRILYQKWRMGTEK